MEKQPAIIFIMGVSGSGKSTIGRRLAASTGLPFFDGDDYHPPANKAKMKAGQALNDNDREGWLTQLNTLAREQSHHQGAIIACSALKEKYREILAGKIGIPVYWVLLHGSYGRIQERMKARKDHFMPPSLLQSQFDTLEAPANAIVVDIENSPEKIVADILHQVVLKGE